MRRTILIHGATNTSNFGDVLFASIFYERMRRRGDIDVRFFEMRRCGVGEFVRKELVYRIHTSIFCIINADALVYMSGGYFGDDQKSIRLTIKRWIRFIWIGSLMLKRNKPVYICGVGGGPIYSNRLRKSIVRIIDHSSFVTMRDEKSAEYFHSAGVKNIIHITADTALIITKNDLPPLDPRVEYELSCDKKEKRLFIHVIHTKETDMSFADKVVPAINTFLSKHPEYGVVFGTDNESCYEHTRTVKEICACQSYHYKYHSAWQLCALLNRMDVIITVKLHVGIIGCSLGKSVISFPVHQHKTKRFYEQINESDRCIQLISTTNEDALMQINRFAHQNITISDEIRNKAQSNLTILDSL